MRDNKTTKQPINIAITGATGFIGQYLVRTLAKSGIFRCRLIIRNQELAYQCFHDIKNETEFFIADITDKKSLVNCFDGCDIVVHLAALVTHTASLEDALSTNRDGTMNLIYEAKKAKIKKFIHTSSTAVIGELKGVITEEAECKPIMSYQVTKYESERVCLSEYAQNSFPVIIIRPSMIYGEGVNQDLLTISRIIRMFHFFPIVGKGENCSPALYVSDMVQAIMLLIEKGKIGEIYHISSETTYPMRKKAEIIARTLGIHVWTPHVPKWLLLIAFQTITPLLKLFGVKFDMEPQNITNSENDRYFDIKKLESLGFRQNVGIEEGIERTIKDFLVRGKL